MSSKRMDETPHTQITDMQGEMALPRENGELVFATPWEGESVCPCRSLAGKRGL